MLKLSNLNCGYENLIVLRDLNLGLLSSEILFLVGPNGSGKSTLLKTLLGQLPPLSGKIQFTTLKTPSMLEANPECVFSITPKELFEINPQSNERNEEIFKLFEMHGILNKDIMTLSAGQAQWVWVAHILSLDSDIILLDEPFSHLDWAHQQRLLEIIKYFKKTYSKTFVIAAHELSLAVNAADCVALLAENELKQFGKTLDVFKGPKIGEVFDFNCSIDENPIDGSKRFTIGKKGV
ncbi:MAG: ABC transporter ATP-binding protein [Oligoflexia bacterium]|nr:ABC transporter ATP-binding protein [Oligoflexia bacterium]